MIITEFSFVWGLALYELVFTVSHSLTNVRFFFRIFLHIILIQWKYSHYKNYFFINYFIRRPQICRFSKAMEIKSCWQDKIKKELSSFFVVVLAFYHDTLSLFFWSPWLPLDVSGPRAPGAPPIKGMLWVKFISLQHRC